MTLSKHALVKRGGGLAAGLVLLAAPPAFANHIGGATYNGTHSQGGTMSFTVTPDGSGVSSFTYAGPIQGDICSQSGTTSTYFQPIPIVNHAFSDPGEPGPAVSGSFPETQKASGTFKVQSSFGCDFPTLTWTATTTATPPAPSPPPGGTPPPAGPQFSERCADARAAARRARRAVARAKKAVRQASGHDARAKAKKKLRKAKKRYRRAKNRAEDACAPTVRG
jgi:hypothetical protein